MAKMFMYRKKVFSVSDRNQFGEFVVVKFSSDLKNVEAAKVIPAKSEQHVEQLVRAYHFENFKNLPDDPTVKSYDPDELTKFNNIKLN
jgi:hypothetical protein